MKAYMITGNRSDGRQVPTFYLLNEVPDKASIASTEQARSIAREIIGRDVSIFATPIEIGDERSKVRW